MGDIGTGTYDLFLFYILWVSFENTSSLLHLNSVMEVVCKGFVKVDHGGRSSILTSLGA